MVLIAPPPAWTEADFSRRDHHLGHGGSATVELAVERATHAAVALKVRSCVRLQL